MQLYFKEININMKDTIALIGITLGKRKTRNAKILFINTISKELMNSHIKVQLHETKQIGSKSTNVMIGDCDRKKILVAGYDTGSKMLIPRYKYYPLNMQKNFASETINMVLYFILILSLLLLYFVYRVYGQVDLIAKISLLIFGCLILFMGIVGIVMPTSPFNFNRNSVAAAILYKLALDKQSDCGYVLTDYTATTYIGYKQLAAYYGNDGKNKTFIILDALSNGEQLYVCTTANLKSEAEKLSKLIGASVYLITKNVENTPLSLFEKCLYITSGFEYDDQLIVANSRNKKDYKINIDMVERIKKGLETYLK